MTRQRLLGTLIVSGFEQAALSRSRISMNNEDQSFYIDEFQDFACHPGPLRTSAKCFLRLESMGFI